MEQGQILQFDKMSDFTIFTIFEKKRKPNAV